MQQVFTTVDLILLPTGEPAGKLEPVAHSSLFTGASLTTPFNVGGNPAFRCAAALRRTACRTPLQIVGRLFEDAAVLRAGHAYENATPWRERRPELN